MSRQSDELLLMEAPEDPEIAAKIKEEKAKRIGKMRECLRLLQELQHNKGYLVVQEYMKGEAEAALSNLERAGDQIELARAAGVYCTLVRTRDFVAKEVQELTETLAQGDGT